MARQVFSLALALFLAGFLACGSGETGTQAAGDAAPGDVAAAPLQAEGLPVAEEAIPGGEAQLMLPTEEEATEDEEQGEAIP